MTRFYRLSLRRPHPDPYHASVRRSQLSMIAPAPLDTRVNFAPSILASAHRLEEVGVALGLLQAIDEKLDRVLRAHRIENPA